VLSDIGAPELLVLALVALFVFGPERLPSMARQAGKALRDLRHMISGIRRDLSAELQLDESDVNLRDLDPRTYVRKNVLEGLDLDSKTESRKARPTRPTRSAERPAESEAAEAAESRPTYDPDAT
jgi:sec-independent protein translocase protein TatB